MEQQLSTILKAAALGTALYAGGAIAQSGDGGMRPVSEFLPAETVKEVGSVLRPEARIHDARATFTLVTDTGTEV